ncbi:MAG: DISARM system phospholipase D-like protein DrmC [Halothece sp.]
MPEELLSQIYQVVATLPPLVLAMVAQLLTKSNETQPNTLSHQVLKHISNAQFRRIVAKLLKTWQCYSTICDRQTLAVALTAAAYSYHRTRQALNVELVWTGPPSPHFSLRRTDQVLLQMIRESYHQLTLISFAVYNVPDIVEALLAALERDVTIRIIAETPDAAAKIPFGITTALGQKILERSQVFIWPIEKRLKDSQGRFGSLHIKGAIADTEHLLITSANLTEYALTLNMEMGLLVHSEDVTSQVDYLFNDLIQQGILVSRV